MQIFLSHSSKLKPLVREVKKNLPTHLNSWIDEEKLLFGDRIAASIEATIKSDTDYVLLFIDDHAATSEWVRKELEWTLQAEKRQNRTILLPIVIEKEAFEKIDNVEIQNRKYIHLNNFLESSVYSLSESISSELFALVCRDMNRLGHPRPQTPLDKITGAETLLRTQAAIIQKTVFPHREPNPISKEKLLDVVNSYNEDLIAGDEFEAILASIVQRNLIPGLNYDGFEAFLIEEHASWKSELHHQRKEQIGRKAVGLIHNGMKVILDAGSTTEEIGHLLCKKIENRAITKVTIATTSVNIADMISDCCVKMGFDDDFSAVRLFIPGGQIRPNTQAIVPAYDKRSRQIIKLAENLEGFDIGFLGVNGVDAHLGFTTHGNAEAENKKDIIEVSNTSVIVGDSSKIGVTLECKFADFEDDICFVVDDDQTNESLQCIVKTYANKIMLA
jgi:DeoR/GlpR family transcriptional regulator of sugar metabolism